MATGTLETSQIMCINIMYLIGKYILLLKYYKIYTYIMHIQDDLLT